ncbi:MAG: flagellar assembly protein FliX [Rhodospirillaceae bacterium]|nr:flagellar assembly protein FliX [Rhodospirillaceae bacterium]
MKVSKVGLGKSTTTASRKKVSAGKGSEFAEHLKEAASVSETSGATESVAVNSMDVILSVQEAPDSMDRRSRNLATRYGADLLDHLEGLRRDLLLGAIPKEKLSNLAQKMRAQRRGTDDPRLNQIIDEIELRAEVEIAKLTR